MAHEIDINEVSTCICRRARRTARRLTVIYDRALAPSGVTANQFDILANLFAASLGRPKSLTIGQLAERLGMHPTTLTRDLRPMFARGWVAEPAEKPDRRTRPVTIAPAGFRALRDAVPLWRTAQLGVRGALGADASAALTASLDLVLEIPIDTHRA